LSVRQARGRYPLGRKGKRKKLRKARVFPEKECQTTSIGKEFAPRGSEGGTFEEEVKGGLGRARRST